MKKWIYKHTEYKQFEIEDCECGSEKTRVEFIREKIGIVRNGVNNGGINDFDFKFICLNCGKVMIANKIKTGRLFV